LKLLKIIIVLLIILASAGLSFCGQWQTVDPDQTIYAIRSAIWNAIPYQRDQADIRFIRTPSPIQAPQGELEIKPVLSQSFNPSGRNIIAVEYSVDGHEYKTVNYDIEIAAKAKVFAAAGNLPAGHVISSDDLAVEMVPSNRINGTTITDPKMLVGLRLRHAVSKGTLFSASALDSPQAVKKGDVVTIIAENGPIQIKTFGVVLQAGGLGNVIKVRNVDSGREILARILDPSTVVIDM